MKNSQVNFRIDSELLNEIKQAAEAVNKPYSQWIIETCQTALGKKTLTLEQLNERVEKIENWIGNQAQPKHNRRQKKKADSTLSEKKSALEDGPRRKGLTHAELARLLDVSPSAVSRWSTGQRKTPKDLEYKFDQILKLWVR